MRRDDLPISARLADLGYTHEEAKSVWIDGVHAIKESATGRVLREMDAIEAACFCLGVEEARADRDRLRSELDAKCAELARVRASASAVFSYLDDRASFGSGNAPGHAHTRPGIWDDDNGTKAGSECEWCKTWNAFRAELARMEEP